MKVFATILASLIFTQFAHADLMQDALGTLTAMRTVYSAEYAPAEWKQQYAGYDLQSVFANSVIALKDSQNLTQKDVREVFKDFVYAMRDYHTSIYFVGTEKASLPLIVHGTANHEYIVYVDRNKLPESTFPYGPGDELVTMDGKPVMELVNGVQSIYIANVPETDRAQAETRLTSRTALRGMDIPQGPVTLGIRKKDETKVNNVQLIWDYTPELINPRGSDFSRSRLRTADLFHPMMDVSVENHISVESPFDVGARKTFTPDLGTHIWESPEDNNFYAYIYKNDAGKLIGYVRIQSYGAADYVKATKDFAAIIKRFQDTTDSMVIDQVNNPGGSVFYLYALASMLTDQPFQTPRHKMAVTQADVTQALAQIDRLKDIKSEEDAKKVIDAAELHGYPVTYEYARFALNYARFIVSEWNAGRKLTNPYWIDGVDHINPGTVHYTKPILLLINHLDFSGGDFFPTILQDNHRVTIMGSRTAGAGGYVVDVTVPNNVGVDHFRVTESIAERVDGNPIENLGVTPDIAYEMTDIDFTNNFEQYAKAIAREINNLH